MRLPTLGELAGKRVRELVTQTGIRDLVPFHAVSPRRFQFAASLDGRSKLAQRVLRHIEAAIFWPSKRALRQTHFLDTERLAVRVPCVLLVRAAVSDMRARHDQRRSILNSPRDRKRRIHSRRIVAVDLLHVPAIGFEARADVLCKREVRRRGERDQVRVVEDDQATEPKSAGKRRRLRRDPFHQVAVARKNVRVVVHDLIAGTIERRRQPPLGNRKSDAVADSLTERSGRDFDAWREPALRMAGRAALPLSKLLEVFEREVIPGQKQQAVQQHAAVPGREDEAVAVGPRRVPGIVPKMTRPQDVGHRGRAHRHTGMPGVCLLNRIDRQHPDRVDAELVHIIFPAFERFLTDRKVLIHVTPQTSHRPRIRSSHSRHLASARAHSDVRRQNRLLPIGLPLTSRT